MTLNPSFDPATVEEALLAHKVAEYHVPGIVYSLKDSIQARIDHHNKTQKSQEKRDKIVGLLQYILEISDHEKFAQVQEKYLDLNDTKFIAGFSKYIDPIRWCESKLNTAMRFGLDQGSPKRIFDIGTGPGHFQVVARYLGHEVLGTEMPSVMKANNKYGEYYQDLEAVYGLQRIAMKIEPDGGILKFENKFDLVTAFLAAFSVGYDKQPWPLETWITFFRNLRNDVLKPDGAVLMTLTRGKVTDDVWAYLTARAAYFNDQNMEIHITDLSWVDADPVVAPAPASLVDAPAPTPTPASTPAVPVSAEKPLVNEWRAALLRRDFATFEALSENITGKDAAKQQYAAARYFTEIGRFDRAAPLWEALIKEPGLGFVAMVRLARARAMMGKPVSIPALIAEFDLPASFEEAGTSTFTTPVVNDVIAPGTRHIAIAGVSFCGSTLTDRILAGLDNVASIGESHWLTTAIEDKKYKEVDFDTVMLNRGTPCSVCGDGCEVLTKDLRTDLIGDKTRWYFKIANRLGTKTLISADKNLGRFIDLDPLMQFTALVLYKPPVDAWYSMYKKMDQSLSEAVYLEKLDAYLDTWYRSYAVFLNHFEPAGGKVVADFRALTERPAELMPKVCAALGLDYDPIILERTKPGHAIGGNSGAMQGLRADDYKVDVRPLGDAELPDSHVKRIRENNKIADLAAALDAAAIR